MNVPQINTKHKQLLLTDVISEVVVSVVLLLDLLALHAVDKDGAVALRPLGDVHHGDSIIVR